MSLSDDEREMLLAVVDRILPPERAPGVAHGPVVAEIERRLETDLAGRAAELRTWLGWLENESFAVFSASFLSLHASTRDELLDRIETENVRSVWTVEPTPFFGELI